MIVVRDVFHLKYGAMREAKALWKQADELMKRVDPASAGNTRVLVDLTGTAYTMVLESTHPSVAEWEAAMPSMFANQEWEAWYHKFTPLVESGSREIYTVVE